VQGRRRRRCKIPSVAQPVDPVRFIERCVVPCADPEQQTQLVAQFKDRLRRATNRGSQLRHQTLADWIVQGRYLKLNVQQALREIQPPARRALYNDATWEVAQEFEAQWKRMRGWERQRRSYY
jgi:hypothetical protein